MKTITRNNYEEFFLDYIEGELNAMEEVVLEAFLAENPDLRDELDEMTDLDIKCEAFDVSEKKSSLKDIPFQVNFDDFCVAHLEGDLDKYENNAFEQYVASHPEKKKELNRYYNTKLVPDKSIGFANKEALKKTKKGFLIKPLLYAGFATAASIALLFSVWTTEIETGTDNVNPNLVSQRIPSQIAKPDSITKGNSASYKIKTSEGNEVVKKPIKTEKQTKNKQKKKTPHKRINRVDVLPIHADASTKKTIEKIKIRTLLADNKPVKLKNNHDLKLVSKKDNTPHKIQNSGLAMLGISWKASRTEERVKEKEKATILKIASYGVSKLGKLAGKKINLEKNYNPDTDKTRVAFNTYGIGFSAPVK